MQECLAVIHNRWYLNSGCSRHMTGDKTKFCLLIESEGGQVTFGENLKGKIIDYEKVGKNLFSCIDDVMLVEGLAYNLLSISQLCDKGHKVLFDSEVCTIFQRNSEVVKFTGKRVNNMYMIDLDDPIHDNLYLTVSKDNFAWLWHHRLGHASYNMLHKLVKFDMVRGLPEISFKMYYNICESCTQGKQTKKSFKTRTKDQSTQPLELIHMDLFELTRSSSLNEKKYGYVLVDDFSRFT